MTENCRKNTAMSLVLTLPDPNVGITNSFPFSRIVGALICSRRNCVARTCLLAATRSPATFSPAEFFPENVKTGIVPSLFYDSFEFGPEFLAKLALPCSYGGLLGVQTCAAVDHFGEFI